LRPLAIAQHLDRRDGLQLDRAACGQRERAGLAVRDGQRGLGLGDSGATCDREHEEVTGHSSFPISASSGKVCLANASHAARDTSKNAEATWRSPFAPPPYAANTRLHAKSIVTSATSPCGRAS